jgi:hypothetical protein
VLHLVGGNNGTLQDEHVVVDFRRASGQAGLGEGPLSVPAGLSHLLGGVHANVSGRAQWQSPSGGVSLFTPPRLPADETPQWPAHQPPPILARFVTRTHAEGGRLDAIVGQPDDCTQDLGAGDLSSRFQLTFPQVHRTLAGVKPTFVTWSVPPQMLHVNSP